MAGQRNHKETIPQPSRFNRQNNDESVIFKNQKWPKTAKNTDRDSAVVSSSTDALSMRSAYSTVTDFARLRGWSTSVPFTTAV